MAAYKRLLDLLRHPTFVTLRTSHETSTPPPCELRNRMSFQLCLPEALDILRTVSPYFEYRPELFPDGDIVPYTEEAQHAVEVANQKPFSGSMSSTRLIPGREVIWRIGLASLCRSLLVLIVEGAVPGERAAADSSVRSRVAKWSDGTAPEFILH